MTPQVLLPCQDTVMTFETIKTSYHVFSKAHTVLHLVMLGFNYRFQPQLFPNCLIHVGMSEMGDGPPNSHQVIGTKNDKHR